MMTDIRIRRLSPLAAVPFRSTDGSAGMDLTAVSKSYDSDGNVVYGTGWAFEIPEGHVGLLFPRSSNARKHLLLSNGVGVVDSDYRGEVTFKFKKAACEVAEGSYTHLAAREYEVGDRVGQIIVVPYPEVRFIESDSLSDTVRGAGGYGHTGH